MDTTSGLLTYLGQRLGPNGFLLVVLVLVMIAVMAGLALAAVGELMGASADPVQVAPVRWLRRF